MKVKIGNRYIYLEENRTQLQRAVKSLRITQGVTEQKIQRVAFIYDVDIKLLKPLYQEEES